MKIRWLLAAIVLPVATWTSQASAWEDYPGFLGPGYAGIAIGDFNGDGKQEVAVTGYANGNYVWYPIAESLLAILNSDASTHRLGISSITPWLQPLSGPLIPAPKEGGADRLAVVGGSGATAQILILGGVPLQVTRIIQAPFVTQVTAIADVDGDGLTEIVALANPSGYGDAYPTVLDYASGTVKWTSATAATDVGVAQLDGDAALELVFASTPGQIVDGATHAVEWSYPSGFGSRVLVGRFGADSKVGIAAMSQWGNAVQIFQSQPYSPVTQFSVGEVAAAAVARLSPQGADEIAIGNGQWGSVSVYDPRTGQALVSSPNPEHGVSALAVDDIDGDGHAEVVYGAGLTSTGEDTLRVVDLATGATDFSQNDESAPYSSIARGDLAGGGSDQVVYATQGSNSGYGGTVVRVLDAASGRRLRERVDVMKLFDGTQPSIAVGQFDADAQNEIVIAGTQYSDGSVALLDGATLADQWRVGNIQIPAYAFVSVQALALVDVNGDGTPDVVTATSASRIVVLDGKDGSLLWQSVTLNGDTPPTLAVLPPANGSAPKMAIGRGAGLYVFDLGSHLLTASVSTMASVTALKQWGADANCRIGALDRDSIITVYSCDTLTPTGQQVMPEDTVFFRTLDGAGTHYLAAAGPYFYEIKPDGAAVVISRELGFSLGAGNRGLVGPSGNDGQHIDVITGSDYMVTRTVVALDAIFANGFDASAH